MINSAALLPSLSRSSGLSPRSAIGLNIIRRDSIAVDRLLKERLVLSKVRYGIERQEQERERRRKEEKNLPKIRGERWFLVKGGENFRPTILKKIGSEILDFFFVPKSIFLDEKTRFWG